MAARVFTVAERPDLEGRLDEVGDPFPEFLYHDEVLTRWWPELYDDLREFQLVLLDEDADAVVGKGCTIPVGWDGQTETLSGGVRDALEDGFARARGGGEANVLCALVAVVDARQQGRGLSGLIIQGMARAAENAGLDCLIAPVRPTWKERYPLAPLERYAAWLREDGLPFDPWIRLHVRLEARILGLAPRSLDVRGTLSQWEEWAAMAFPASGDYVVPGALVPVTIDRELDEGRYMEPNVWMRHESLAF